DNAKGQLGNGGKENSYVPAPVSGLGEAKAVSIESLGSGSGGLALLASGTVQAWGLNEFGQLGDGGSEASVLPVPVSGLSEVTAVAAGEQQNLALLKQGTVMAWGATTTGPEKCEVSAACSKTPVPVSGLSGVSSISAGGGFDLALLNDGTVM